MKLRDLPRGLAARARQALRRGGLLPGPRPLSDAEVLRAVEAMYQSPDPWRMASDKEQFRFAETDRILRQHLLPGTKVGSILEIGCGEGHQSEHLARLCDRLTGIDVAAKAVERARFRVPGAELLVGALHAQPWAAERNLFDLVTAFEVVYLFGDIPAMLAAMSRLGRACAISYYDAAAWLVEPPLRAVPLAGRESFAFDGTEWHAAWWRPEHHARREAR
jgi:SAM-dependent methyltransferase